METKIKLLKNEGTDKASGLFPSLTDIVLIVIVLVAFISQHYAALFFGYLLKLSSR